MRIGDLPAAGEWVRLSLPAPLVGLSGRIIRGMAFTLHGGRATWDCAGKRVSADPKECERLLTQRADQKRKLNGLINTRASLYERLKTATVSEKREILAELADIKGAIPGVTREIEALEAQINALGCT